MNQKELTYRKAYSALQDLEAKQVFKTEDIQRSSYSSHMTRLLMEQGHMDRVAIGLYQWNGTRVTYDLAKELVDICAERTNKQKRRRKTSKSVNAKRQLSPLPTVADDNMAKHKFHKSTRFRFSFLWGLIRIERN